MKLSKFWKFILAIVIVLALSYIAHGIGFYFEDNLLDNNIKPKSTNNAPSSSVPIFSVNFLDEIKNKQLNNNFHNNMLNSLISNISGDFNSLSGSNHQSNNSLLLGLDTNVAGVGQNSNPGIFDGKPSIVIDDALEIEKEGTLEEEKSDDGETVFVTDNATGILLSCAKYSGKYKCHTAVHNLFNPQGIFALNNHLYIVNMHEGRESGDITVCDIRNSGLIEACKSQIIPLKTPAFLYYESSKLYIIEFFYVEKLTEAKVISCSLDNSGNIVYSSCAYDVDIEKMKFISKYYNGFYYRAHAKGSAKYIDKCGQINSSSCDYLTNDKLDNPLGISIYNGQMFITDEAMAGGSRPSYVLKCDMNLFNCSIVTTELTSPRSVGVFNFAN